MRLCVQVEGFAGGMGPSRMDGGVLVPSAGKKSVMLPSKLMENDVKNIFFFLLVGDFWNKKSQEVHYKKGVGKPQST